MTKQTQSTELKPATAKIKPVGAIFVPKPIPIKVRRELKPYFKFAHKCMYCARWYGSDFKEEGREKVCPRDQTVLEGYKGGNIIRNG